MKKFVIFSVALLILAMPGIAVAQESVDGVIEGQVLNRTVDGGNVTDLDITLIPFIGQEIQDTATTETDEQGRFHFSSLSTEPDHTYFVIAHYMGIDYDSDPLIFGANETAISIELAVFEPTTSDDLIGITLAHPIVEVKDDSLLVTEYYQYINAGDRIYIGSQDATSHEHMGTLSFSIPSGALIVEADEGLIQAGNNVIHTIPILPGIGEVGYSYSLAKSESGDYIVPVEIRYPTDKLNIMVQGGSDATSTQLSQATMQMGGQQVIRLTGNNLPRGTTFDVSISAAADGGIGTPLIVGIAAAIIAFCIIIS